MQVNIESAAGFTANMNDDGKVTYIDKTAGMDKFEIIVALERRYVRNPLGKYYQVLNSHYCLPEGNWALLNYSLDRLENMLENSISEMDVRIETSERLLELHRDKI